MKLGKLLAAGKSIVNSCAEVSYRAEKKVYLPKFGSDKNPFVAAAKPEISNDVALPAAKIKVAAKTQKLPDISATPKSLATWTSKLNPMTLLRGSSSSATGAQTPVQTELSLERVKVVHNDLSDADVEIVPIKSRPALEADKSSPTPKNPWEVLGERLLKATAL